MPHPQQAAAFSGRSWFCFYTNSINRKDTICSVTFFFAEVQGPRFLEDQFRADLHTEKFVVDPRLLDVLQHVRHFRTIEIK